MQIEGFFWFLATLMPLIFLQRLLHREIQAVLLIMTRDARMTISIFQVIFLPGVFLHEASHFLAAKILRVQTGRFSIFPRPLPNGRLQLGYVEVARSDIVRDSLIGAAPLIFGTLFVSLITVYTLDMRVLWDTLRNGQVDLFVMGLGFLPRTRDFYFWFYLVFTISSTMMPSESDRHAWLEMFVAVGVILIFALLVGAGPWMLDNVAPAMSNFLKSIAVIFGMSALIHGLLVLPIALIHRLLSRATGLDVE
jgi:hypothetical protein